MHFPAVIIALTLSLVPILNAEARNAKQELADGVRAAESYNWAEAGIHFHSAQLRLPSSATKEQLLAKVGFMRSTMEQRNLAELTRQYQTLAQNSAVRNDPYLRMWLYIAKGDCDNDLQFPEAARRDWQTVQQIAVDIKDPKWTYRSKGELAIPAYYLGDLASSRQLVTEALQAATAAKDSASVVRLLTHIGTVFMLRGDFAKGMDHLGKADQLAARTPESGYPVNVKEGELLGLIGTGKLDEAMVLANEIITRMHSLDQRINEAQTRVMLAGIYQKQKNITAALRELKDAIQISEKGNYYHSLSEAQFALANLYLQIGDLRRSSDWVASSVDSSRRSGIVSDLPAHMLQLARLRVKEARYTEAASIFKKAEDEVDAQLALTPMSTKPLLLRSTSNIYTDHFELSAEHFHDIKNEYAIIERVRGRMLTDLLKSGSFSDETGAGSAEQEVSALRLKLASATTASDVARARDAVFFARHKRWLNKETGSAPAFRQNTGAVLPIAVVQRKLKHSEALVEYVVAAQSVYAIVITNRSAHLAKVGATATVNEAADRFVTAVRGKQSAWKEGAALYGFLFNSIPEVASHSDLVLIPDGQLYSVPFAALVVDGKRLVETHSIIRAPSVSSYVLLGRRTDGAVHHGLLAVGGVRYNSDLSRVSGIRGYGENLSNLPGSQEEADAASDVLGPLLGRSLLLEDTSATETAVKDALRQEREVVHLAVHGMSHTKDDPELAALVFLQDKVSGEDGILEVPEILRMHLRSDLVVLSACETAVGELQGEEGVSNLSRSFLLAGAKSVTSTLWSVDDAFSATLMKHFYQSLVAGVSKANALEDAQRYVLTQFTGTAVPWYWAGYVIEGDASGPLPTFEANNLHSAQEKRVHTPSSSASANGGYVSAR